MNCKQCGGVMTIDQDKRLFVCPYCGTVEPFDKVSKKDLDKAVNEIKQTNKQMVDKIVADNKKTLMAAKAENTGKDIIIIVLLTIFLIIAVIMTAYCFDTGYYFPGIISTLQIVFVFGAIVLRSRAKVNGNAKMSLASSVLAGLAILFIIVWLIGLGTAEDNKSGKYDTEKAWPTLGMGSDLPEPDKPCYDLYNTDKYLSARIDDVDKTFFENYVKKCKEAGYDVDGVLDSYTYTAYNKNDDKLELNLFYGTELSITMNKALQFTEFYWPKSGGAQYLPEPKADKVCIESLNDYSAKLYIADVDKSYMIKYIDELKTAGFPGSYDDKNEKFRSKKDNVSVDIELQRGRIMYFDIYILSK